jgi:hypothetical protein
MTPSGRGSLCEVFPINAPLTPSRCLRKTCWPSRIPVSLNTQHAACHTARRTPRHSTPHHTKHAASHPTRGLVIHLYTQHAARRQDQGIRVHAYDGLRIKGLRIKGVYYPISMGCTGCTRGKRTHEVRGHTRQGDTRGKGTHEARGRRKRKDRGGRGENDRTARTITGTSPR